MATRMKMLKLLQEVHTFTSFSSRRPQARPPGALVLPIRSLRSSMAQRKRSIRVSIQDPPDIPTPVKIVFLEPAPAGPSPGASAAVAPVEPQP